MFGVSIVVFPKQPRSPMPRSSTTIRIMFGLFFIISASDNVMLKFTISTRKDLISISETLRIKVTSHHQSMLFGTCFLQQLLCLVWSADQLTWSQQRQCRRLEKDRRTKMKYVALLFNIHIYVFCIKSIFVLINTSFVKNITFHITKLSTYLSVYASMLNAQNLSVDGGDQSPPRFSPTGCCRTSGDTSGGSRGSCSRCCPRSRPCPSPRAG